jgi:hypothetical protein
MGGDWALGTMAEGLIRVNARRQGASGSRLGRCARDVQGITAEVAFMADVREG